MRTLLRFCYLFILTLSISCGETSQKKETEKAEKPHSAPVGKVDHADTKVILFFGNSLTAGMGIDPNEAFPTLIQEKLDSLDLNYKTINAGLSGETTASGKNRVEWVLNQKVSIFVLELGANDGLRGIPLEETRKNLQDIIDIVWAKDPNTLIVLAGMQIPPNMGPDYTKGFSNIFPELAEKNKLSLIPFLLEDVAGIPDLNQADGIHPTEEGHRIIAETIWPIIDNAIRQ
ncbi:MAG TPA: arylesterase [Arenibacter sp.]|nr:arylesterase [Arenibacter sp.]